MMYVVVFIISLLIGCGVSVFILAVFNADKPTQEEYNDLKQECDRWHRMAVSYRMDAAKAQQLQEVWKATAIKRGETDAEESAESKE